LDSELYFSLRGLGLYFLLGGLGLSHHEYCEIDLRCSHQILLLMLILLLWLRLIITIIIIKILINYIMTKKLCDIMIR